MLIRDYDEALLAKIRKMYKHTYYTKKPNDIEEIRNSSPEDKLIYPYICISRISVPKLIENPTNSHRFGIGSVPQRTRVDFSKFSLTYQVDICSKTRDAFDTLLVELQLALLKNPTLVVSTDTALGDVTPTIIMEDLADTSDIDAFDTNLQVYRATLDLQFDAIITRTTGVEYIEVIEVVYPTLENSQ